MSDDPKCGFVSIVGRANVGKSTLFNKLLGDQLSVATYKPHTTRHNIRGILTLERCQLVLIDTPGIQLGNRRLMNRVLLSNALSSLQEVDVILMLIEPDTWNHEDEYLLGHVRQAQKPVVLMINKVDRIRNKSTLLPLIDRLKSHHAFSSIVPFSALHDREVTGLVEELCAFCPASDFLFPADMKWDRDDRFVISEVVRAVAMTLLQKELPYALYTEVEQLEFQDKLVTATVILWVEKDSQKPIVIGRRGSKLKEIGEHARLRLERVFNRKVMLRTWVKVKKNWQDQQGIVSQFR